MAEVLRRPLDAELDELARAAPAENARPLLVVHRREACSGSAAAVLMGPERRFFGSVAPGEAALLTVPADLTEIEIVSAVEVTAPVRSWFISETVAVPPFPGGLLLTARRVSARECWSNGQYANVKAATKAELEGVLAEADVTWLEPRPADGQRWLDRHRARVDEILAGRAERCSASPVLSPSYCPEATAPLDAFVPAP